MHNYFKCHIANSSWCHNLISEIKVCGCCGSGGGLVIIWWNGTEKWKCQGEKGMREEVTGKKEQQW